MRTLPLLALAVLGAAPLPAQQDWTRWIVVNGPAASDLLGFSVAPLGDVTGDGKPEFLVGAYGSDLNGRNSGAVYVLNGATGVPVLSAGGQQAGDLLGFAVVGLSDYDGDGKPDFAVSSPYFSTGPAGFFAGRVYVVSSGSGAVLDILDGSAQAEVFGASLAGVDLDGDGRLELLAGAIGATGTRGRVDRFAWSGGGMVSAGTSWSGDGSGEMYGYALSAIGALDAQAGDEFLVGIPFADDGATDSGAVEILGSGRSFGVLTVPTAGANLGFSVTGNRDLSGDGRKDLAAGAPGAGAGSVIVWSGASGSPVLATLQGSASGERFGNAVSFLNDANFDGRADVAVGAPYATSRAGRVAVYDINASGGPAALSNMAGTAGSRFGWSLAAVGDLQSVGVESIAVGAPYHTEGNLPQRGRVEAWTPPDTNLPPPDLSIGGDLVQAATVPITVTNIRVGSTVYFYSGRNHTASTSQEGFSLDISGRLTGSGALTAFDVKTNVTSGTATGSFVVPFPNPGVGTTIWFEAIEVRGGLIRDSDEESGVIEAAPFTLAMEGTMKVGQQIRQHTTFGNANNLTYFYVSTTGEGASQAPDGTWTLGILDALVWPGGGSPTSSNAQGEAFSTNWTLPSSTANRQLWFQAFSWHSQTARRMLSNIVTGVVAP